MSINLPLVTNRVSTWVALKGKPYITVSAKGISNGKSTILNDGADFGPDTMLGATSKDQYGSPYTQTVGIQEAINYVFNQGGGEIFFNKGTYDFTNSPLVNPGAGPVKIYIPSNNSDTTINIAMVGEGIPGGAWAETNATSSNGEVLFIDNSTTNYDGTLFYVSPAAFGVGTLNNVSIYIDKIHFKMSYASGSTPIAIDQAGESTVGIIYIDTDQLSTSNNLINRTGLFLSTGATDTFNYAEAIYIQGYQYGLYVGGHTQINHLTFQNVYYGIYPDTTGGSGYIIGISKLTAQYITGALIYNPNSTAFGINIDTLDIGDGVSNTTSLINDAGNLSARITYHYNGETPSPSNIIVGSTSNYELIPIGSNDYYQSTTNGTTSGTVEMKLVKNSTQYKKYIITFSSYENDTTTAQVIDFPLPFNSYAVISANNTGLNISASTSGITITAPNSTTTYSGIIIVEGY